MRRCLKRLLLSISGRHLLPLLLLILVAAGSALNYIYQIRLITASVQQTETVRLRERLGLEQTRLDVLLGNGEPMAVQRTVSAMGLYDGLMAAYIEGEDRRVLASLSRTEIGRPAQAVLQARVTGVFVRGLVDQPSLETIDIQAVPEQTLLFAVAPLTNGNRLVALVDFGHTWMVRRDAVRVQAMWVALVALLAAGALAWLLHLMWFRRAQRLADALATMGAGNLAVRSGLGGGDELALIGKAADGMAEQLQTHRAIALRMTGLVARSPLVVFEWRNESGWPVDYVSESIAQWGYTVTDFQSGGVSFADLIHPDDVGRVSAEVFNYLERGPDAYRQQYRIRNGAGDWIWVDDRTTLARNEQGKVVSIGGILLDITAQKEAERVQIEQSELLRMFYELPFLGMAISSPVDKRWLQVNDRLCDMLGYSREELLRMTWAEMTPPDDRERNVVLFDELLAGKRTGYQMSKCFVRKDGALVHVEIDVRAVRDANGQPRQLFATIQDVTERHRSEAALRPSEHSLLEAQRIGRMGSWVRDCTTGEGEWSDELYRILEVDPKSFAPTVDSLLSLIVLEDRPVVSQAMALAVAQGDRYELAFRVQTGSGTKYLRAKGELEMEAGRPLRLVGTVLDVTDITLAQKALQEQEALLAEAQAVAHIGNWRFDLSRRHTTWSNELFKLLGCDPQHEQASIERFVQAVHPNDRERVQALLKNPVMSSAQNSQIFEHRVETPDGVRELEHRLRVAVGGEGRVVRIFGTVMDVTERRKAERVSQDYKEMLEHAEALVGLGSWSGDVESQHLTISDQLYRNMGLDPSHRTPTDAEYIARIHPEDRAAVIEDMQRIRSGQDADELLLRTDPAWGPMRWLRRSVRSIPREAKGRGPRYIGALLDITEEVVAEERLKRLNQELEQRVVERTEQLREANQELEAFSYTVSHDLKAPLRGIDGYSQLLAEEYGPKLGEEGRQFVQRIRQGVQQMSELITDLLAYSKIERREMAHEPVDVRLLVQQVVDSYQAEVGQMDAEVRLQMAPLTLALDRDGMAVVLRNLIGNALKFSRHRKPPVIEIGSHADGGRRILWVRDNGVGFDMKYHDRIFGIFQRLHRAEEFPGTGVGLALVTKAVQRMGGRVWAESALGKGSTFYMEFPE